MRDESKIAGRLDMIGLTYGEQLIVWGLRRIVTERGPDGLLLDECYGAFGGDGDEALRTLCLFLCLLGHSARQIFEIGSPGLLVMTRDESRILTLLAAAQRCAEAGDLTLLDAHLRWLAPTAHRPPLAQVSLALGNLLAAHGHWLSLPAAAAPPPRRALAGHAGDRRADLFPVLSDELSNSGRSMPVSQ